MGLSVARAIDRRFERAQMVSKEELALNNDDVNQKNIAEKIKVSFEFNHSIYKK